MSADDMVKVAQNSAFDQAGRWNPGPHGLQVLILGNSFLASPRLVNTNPAINVMS